MYAEEAVRVGKTVAKNEHEVLPFAVLLRFSHRRTAFGAGGGGAGHGPLVRNRCSAICAHAVPSRAGTGHVALHTTTTTALARPASTSATHS